MKHLNPLPPLETLRALFTYQPETGLLLARVGHGKRKAGEPVGYLGGKGGYLCATVNNQNYRVHRICWALHHGRDPFPLIIDHRNRNRTDNRACNLRAVSSKENRANATDGSRPVLLRYPDGATRLLPSQCAASRELGLRGKSTVARSLRSGRPLASGIRVLPVPPTI